MQAFVTNHDKLYLECSNIEQLTTAIKEAKQNWKEDHCHIDIYDKDNLSMSLILPFKYIS